MLTPEKQNQLLNWVETSKQEKILTCTAIDVETLCPRVYASPHWSYVLYEVAEGLIFSIGRKPGKYWSIPTDFDEYLQVYLGYEKSEENAVIKYFQNKADFNIRKSKRPESTKKPWELKLTRFKVYDVLCYFETTRLDSVLIVF